MGSVCSTNGAKRNAHRILVGKPEEAKYPCVDNIKLAVREIGRAVMTGLILFRVGTSGG
jgi:hypothetical protein